MLNKYYKLLAILFALLFVVSCSDDDTNDTPAISESQVLVDYIEANYNYIATDAPTMIAADAVKEGIATGDVYVIDIRSAADYANGHIATAINVALKDLLTYYESNNLQTKSKVAIACYSGQTASYGTSMLRLLGYKNVFTLKFGMSSWNVANINSWKNNVGNARASEFVTTPTPKGAMGNLPVLNTGKKTGAEILRARVQEALEAGFDVAKISQDNVFANLGGYYIVNYWTEAHYNDPGHIPGAMQYTPKESMKLAADLKTLPTDKPIVLYCYTGQTSAHLAAYLRVLGYDAKSLLYGANGMIYNLMDGKTGFTTWKDTDCKGYELVK